MHLARWLIVLLVLMFVPAHSWAAITFDASTTMEGLTTTSGNATIAADANVALICLAQRDTNSSGITANTASVTVGGEAATQLSGVCSDSCGALAVRAVWFYKLAPATGTVAIAATSDTGTDRIVTGVVSYKGVAQTSTFNTPGTNSSTSSAAMDVDSLASAIGELGVLCGAISGSGTTPSADATVPVSTERVDTAHTNATSVRVTTYEEAGDTSTINMRVDLSASVRWAAVAASMRESGAAASVPSILLLGVGK